MAGSYADVHSGFELWERPRLGELREAVRAGKVEAVIAYALDRLSRRQVHTAILVDECERAGVALLFVTEEFEKSAVGDFIRSAKAFAAELEREKIRERTVRGMQARVRSGKLRPGAKPLYGYRWRDEARATLAIDPDTAPIVRRIFRELGEGHSQRGVAEGLNRDGIPTPMAAPYWRHPTIREIAANPAYTGVAVGNRWECVKEAGTGRTKRRARPAGEHVLLPEGTIPALVTADELAWANARAARPDLARPRTNRAPELHLLRGGFVLCGACGRKVHAAVKPGRYPTSPVLGAYRTAKRQGEHYDCEARSISAKILDAAVWGKVEALLTDPATVAREVARLREADPTAADLATVDGAIGDVGRRRANLAKRLALFDDDEAAAPLVAELAILARQKGQLEQERVALLMRRTTWEAAQAGLASLERWCRDVGANLAEATYVERRQLLVALGVQVRLYPQGHTPRYEITAAIPLDGGEADSIR